MDARQIKKITVEKLFGLYDYELTVNSNATDNVFILYGDNGAGKSTILKLTYHLLSSEIGNGHKTYIANVPFKLFSIEFDDETLVQAEREDIHQEFIGTYTLRYKLGDTDLSSSMPCEWNEAEHEYRIRFSLSSENNGYTYREILYKLKEINIYYISYNRNERQNEYPIDLRSRRTFQQSDPVEKEMSLLHDWIVSQALESSKKGEAGTSEIYAKILSKLGYTNANKEKVLTLDNISNEIENLENRAKSYAKMGFIPETDYTKVRDKLKKVRTANSIPAANILMPYLEIQKNRLDALDYLFETVDYLVESLNDYLYKKFVIYSVTTGFKIFQKTNDLDKDLGMNIKNLIEIKKMSSGERQLLRLFSMVIRKSNVCPIIIIDEPEISLNIKWQRRLLSTLNYFVRKSHAQFIIATHSFEIIASHTENTVKVGETYIP